MSKLIQVVSYNIENGSHPQEIISSLKGIARSKNTIFCLQEVRPTKGIASIIDILKENFPKKEWGQEYFLSNKNQCIDLGLAILWNHKNIHLKGIKKVLLPKLKTFNLIERIWTTGGKPIQRGTIIATFRTGKKTLRVVNLHLDWQGGFEQKKYQLNHLVSILKKMSSPDPEVICGDFNTTGTIKSAKKEEVKVRKILGNYKNITPEGYTSGSNSPDYSHPYYQLLQTMSVFGINIKQRLDYTFVKGVEVVSTKVENVKGSDHYPLVTTLSI